MKFRFIELLFHLKDYRGYFFNKTFQEIVSINSKTDAENIRSDFDKVLGTWWHNKTKKK